jgi:hypothetical protein
MKHKSASVQPDLFEDKQPRTSPLLYKEQLATLLEALLLEIAAALVIRKTADDQDHG